MRMNMKMENEKAFPEGIPYTKNKPPHQKFWCVGKGFVLRQAQDGERSRTRTAKLSIIFEPR